jgi:hypothetical protein
MARLGHVGVGFVDTAAEDIVYQCVFKPYQKGIFSE